MNWDDLRYLLAVHETGSLTAAARRLKVDQSTVSRRLDALQRSAGARLLERTPKGARLNAAGELALETARSLAEATDALERRLAGADARLTGTVRLTAPETVASHLLCPHIPELHQAQPGLQLEIDTSPAALNLARREADLAVRFFRPREPSLAARRLGVVAFALYASRAYVAKRGRPRPGALEGHLVLGYDETLAATEDKQWLDRVAARGTVVLRSTSRHAVFAAARAGAGVTVLPCYLADPERELVRLSDPADAPTRSLWLAVHQDLQHTPRVRAAIDFVTGAFRAEAARLAG